MTNYNLDSSTYERLYRQTLQAESVLNLLISDGQSIEGFESAHSTIMGAIDNAVELVEKIRDELSKLESIRGKNHA